MSEACIKQIRYWHKTIKQLQKAIRRKNKLINRLQRENDELISDYASLMASFDEEVMADD